MPFFLELPPEIRNIIYSLLLVGSEPVDLSQSCLASSLTHTTILSTARAIYNEAVPILYGRNHFVAHHPFQLSFTTDTTWRMVRHVSFYIRVPRQAWEGTEEDSWLRYLDSLDNFLPILHRLELHFLPLAVKAHASTVRKIKRALEENNKAKEVFVFGHHLFVDDVEWARRIQTRFIHITPPLDPKGFETIPLWFEVYMS